jgi:hypothetical protein
VKCPMTLPLGGWADDTKYAGYEGEDAEEMYCAGSGRSIRRMRIDGWCRSCWRIVLWLEWHVVGRLDVWW